MIETCSRRCMLFGTICLGIVTIVVLILESHMADSLGNQRMKNRTFPTENNSTCWMNQHYVVINECHPCSEFEIKSKSIGVCIHTNYKEILKCDDGETVTRSCDRVAYLEERAYWKFTIWTLVVAFCSSIAVMLRLRALHHKAQRRARQILSNGCIN